MPRLAKPDRLAKAIGRRVRALRTAKKLTLEKLAYGNGVNKGTVSDLEQGLARPSVVVLKRIADGLDVELLDLFTTPADNSRHLLIERSRGLSRVHLRQLLELLDTQVATAKKPR